MKIRENRLAVLRQFKSSDWISRDQIQADLFLLIRMVEEGLIEGKSETKNGSWVFKYRLKNAPQKVS